MLSGFREGKEFRNIDRKYRCRKKYQSSSIDTTYSKLALKFSWTLKWIPLSSDVARDRLRHQLFLNDTSDDWSAEEREVPKVLVDTRKQKCHQLHKNQSNNIRFLGIFILASYGSTTKLFKTEEKKLIIFKCMSLTTRNKWFMIIISAKILKQLYKLNNEKFNSQLNQKDIVMHQESPFKTARYFGHPVKIIFMCNPPYFEISFLK